MPVCIIWVLLHCRWFSQLDIIPKEHGTRQVRSRRESANFELASAAGNPRKQASTNLQSASVCLVALLAYEPVRRGGGACPAMKDRHAEGIKALVIGHHAAGVDHEAGAAECVVGVEQAAGAPVLADAGRVGGVVVRQASLASLL